MRVPILEQLGLAVFSTATCCSVMFCCLPACEDSESQQSPETRFAQWCLKS